MQFGDDDWEESAFRKILLHQAFNIGRYMFIIMTYIGVIIYIYQLFLWFYILYMGSLACLQ